eukprot:2136738-Amphidinium_carterae.1
MSGSSDCSIQHVLAVCTLHVTPALAHTTRSPEQAQPNGPPAQCPMKALLPAQCHRMIMRDAITDVSFNTPLQTFRVLLVMHCCEVPELNLESCNLRSVFGRLHEAVLYLET